MTQKLRVIVFPDAASIYPASLFQACLYFDEVYLEGWIPETLLPDRTLDGGLTVRLRKPSPAAWLAPLRKAGIVRSSKDSQAASNATGSVLESFSTRELSLNLREAIAGSMKQGATLLTASLLAISDRTLSVPLPYTVSCENPADRDDGRFELAVASHLSIAAAVLAIAQQHSLAPLVVYKSHTRMLMKMADSFPSVARALRLSDESLQRLRHASLAQTILEEFLPAIHVRHPEDVVGLRDALRDELHRFRAEVGRLAALPAADITADGGRLPGEIESIMAKEVRPAIADLRAKLTKPSRRIAKHLVSDWTTIASGSAFPLTAMFIQSAALPWAILGGLSAGVGLAALKAKVEEWSVKQASPFTFVLEAERRL